MSHISSAYCDLVIVTVRLSCMLLCSKTLPVAYISFSLQQETIDAECEQQKKSLVPVAIMMGAS